MRKPFSAWQGFYADGGPVLSCFFASVVLCLGAFHLDLAQPWNVLSVSLQADACGDVDYGVCAQRRICDAFSNVFLGSKGTDLHGGESIEEIGLH